MDSFVVQLHQGSYNRSIMAKFLKTAAAGLGVLILGGTVALAQAPQPTPDAGNAPTAQSTPKKAGKKKAKKKAGKKKTAKTPAATQPPK
jgi:hypothetical protein